MKAIWRQKWQNLARKRVQSGLYARSSAVTLRGEAILPSFGFGRFGHLLRRERLENEPTARVDRLASAKKGLGQMTQIGRKML